MSLRALPAVIVARVDQAFAGLVREMGAFAVAGTLGFLAHATVLAALVAALACRPTPPGSPRSWSP